MIGPACFLCGRRDRRELPDETEAVATPAGHEVTRCGGCGLVALQPPFSDGEKAAIYAPGYYEAYAAAGGMAGGTVGMAPHLAGRLARAGRLAGRGRMLDVGCGQGFLLAYAESAGWQADGIEASPAAAAAQRRIARGRVFHGPVEAAPFDPGSYRFVHLNHVLEHLDDPLGALRLALEWLAPGGVLVVEVPNEFATLYFRVGQAFLPMSLRRNPVPTSHQWFFDPRTLRAVAEKAGVRIDRLGTVRHAIGLRDRSWAMRWAKRLVYLCERPLQMAGMIELWGGQGPRGAAEPWPVRGTNAARGADPHS